MAFSNRANFDFKTAAALRALKELRTRAESQLWVAPTDSDYIAGGIQTILNDAISLNGQINSPVRFGPPSLILAASDDFNRADSTSSLGLGWQLYGNAVAGVHSDTGYFASGAPTVATKGRMRDGTVAVTINSQDYTAVGLYVVFHFVDQNNYMLLGSSGNSTFTLYSKVGGTVTSVRAFDFGSGFFSNSDPKAIAAVVTGKSVAMYAGGVLRDTGTIPDVAYNALISGYGAGIAADDTSRGFNTNFAAYSVVPA